MKATLVTIISMLMLSTPAMAVNFKVGKNVGSLTPRLIRTLLRQGKDNFEGTKIVISKDAQVPAGMRKKWDERKLSGESVPEIGEKSDDVIFIEGF